MRLLASSAEYFWITSLSVSLVSGLWKAIQTEHYIPLVVLEIADWFVITVSQDGHAARKKKRKKRQKKKKKNPYATGG